MTRPPASRFRFGASLVAAVASVAVSLGACSNTMSDWQAAYDTGLLSFHDTKQQLILLNEAKRLADTTKDVDAKLKTNNALAETYTRIGKFDEALKLRQENVALAKSDTNHGADLAVAYAKLATAYDLAKQTTSALDAANKGWQVSQSAKPELTKEQKAEVLMGKGIAEYLTADKQGVTDIKNALKIHKDLWGEDDVRVLSDMDYLAEAYERSGDIDKAIDTEHKVVDARERVFQPWDPSVYKSLQLYLDLLELAGRKSEAVGVDALLTQRLAEYAEQSPSGLKSGGDLYTHGYLPPLPPDLKSPRGHFKKSS